MTPAVVLDASAGVEIALWTEQGSRLASVVLEADEIAVPDHFHLECASARGASSSAVRCRPPRRRRRSSSSWTSASVVFPRHRFSGRRGACDTISPWPMRFT